MNQYLKCSAAVILSSLLVATAYGCSPRGAAAGTASSDNSTSSAAVSSETPASSAGESSQVSSATDVSSSVSSDSLLTETEKSTMTSITEAAKKGKVLGCDFAAKANCIEDVQKVWGKGEKPEYVAAAKGTYISFPKEGMVFGFNKGSQITEVRTFDSQLQKTLTLSKIEGFFGKPAYEVNSSKEKIIGYVANKDFKMLFVFETSNAVGDNPALDHYSVLFPAGTVNSMADDPGREW